MATLTTETKKVLLITAASQLFDADPIATEYVFLGIPTDELTQLRDEAVSLAGRRSRRWTLTPEEWDVMKDKIDSELGARQVVGGLL